MSVRVMSFYLDGGQKQDLFFAKIEQRAILYEFPIVNTHSCCKGNIRDAFQNVLLQSRRLSGFEKQAENCKLRLFISPDLSKTL